MASSKRRPNKQKRSRQNRLEREARRARSAHAGEATEIARGEREPAPAKTSSGRATGKAKGAGGKQPRRRRESPFKIPGQRAVVMSFLFALVAAATLLLAPIQVSREVPPDDPRVEDEDPDVGDDGLVTIYEDAKLLDEEGAAVAAGVMLTPIAITGAAVWFTKRPQRSTAWTMAMVALAGYIFLFAGPYGIITLPSLIALAVGGFQSRRAEQRERLAEIRAERDARAEGESGEVIDVEPVGEVDDEAEEAAGERD